MDFPTEMGVPDPIKTGARRVVPRRSRWDARTTRTAGVGIRHGGPGGSLAPGQRGTLAANAIDRFALDQLGHLRLDAYRALAPGDRRSALRPRGRGAS